MKVVILGYEGHLLASPTRLRDAAVRLGIDLSVESPDDLSVCVRGSEVVVTLGGAPLGCDALIPRGTVPVGPFLDVALSAVADSGTVVVNSPPAIRICEDKLRTAVVLARAGIPQLATAGVLPGGVCPPWPEPVYVKPAWGRLGRGVVRFGSVRDANLALSEFRRVPVSGPLVQHLVVQPAALSFGVDYRVLVARGAAVAAVERRVIDGGAVSTGGASRKQLVPVGEGEDLCALGVSAAEAVGADFAGVDVVVHDGVPHVLEVNASPGLEVTVRYRGLTLRSFCCLWCCRT